MSSSTDTVLDLVDLHKRYGATVALRGLNLSVPRGSFYGLFGRNGAGKTTTFDLVTGLIARDRGHVTLLGETFDLEPTPETKRRFAYVGGHLQLYGTLTLEQHLSLVAEFYPTWDDDHCRELLGLFRLSLKQLVLGLSPGMHLQFQIVMALARHPELLILDEPGNLDPVVRARLMISIMEIVREHDATVIMASHLLDELQGVCDHMCIIDRGQALLAGPTAEITAGVREIRLYGVQATTPPDLPQVTFVDALGADWRAVIMDCDDKQVEALVRAVQPKRWEIAPVGLQDFFIALTAERE